jgi:pimeloyl-ACP methyl ester carboxylesterase
MAGHPDEALDMVQRVAAAVADTPDGPAKARVLADCAQVLMNGDRHPESEAAARTAGALARAVGDPIIEVETGAILAVAGFDLLTRRLAAPPDSEPPRSDRPVRAGRSGLRLTPLPQGPRLAPETRRPDVRPLLRPGRRPAPTEAMHNSPSRLPLLSQITAPTTIIHGSDDQLIDAAASITINTLIHNSTPTIYPAWDTSSPGRSGLNDQPDLREHPPLVHRPPDARSARDGVHRQRPVSRIRAGAPPGSTRLGTCGASRTGWTCR